MQAMTIVIDQQSYPVLNLPGRPKAILDKTAGEIFLVPTKRINEAVKNNPEKFPPDFYFELTLEEARTLDEVENFDLIWKKGHLPKAFTPPGANMLATILRSEVAVRRAIQIVRAFTALENVVLSSDPDDPLSLIAVQSRMIATLADEMYKNRQRIENYGKQMACFDMRLTNLEQRQSLEKLESQSNTPIPDSPISSTQAQILRNIVKQKGKNKKKMMRIWSLFKRQFDLTRFAHLPKEKFEAALQWLKKLEI